ncbi:cupin domain-containing protein [Azotobacter chroococcum]|uniref:cupin domain-containing protein n=1 Tax=Azotobacter chroococcum TaxID=353 RepID=UPI00103A19D5|nr:cupin domain-containing protein [Azotobacter chroococcum]TBW33996.1 cupin domain-containing protein [Azotobacter chroococcum]
MSETPLVVDYTRYRAHFHPAPAASRHWNWAELLLTLQSASHTERGSLTLTRDGTVQGCELLPGMAINIQRVPAGGRTLPHAHSWWHLFLVQEGRGVVQCADEPCRQVSEGDLLLVPPGVMHRIENNGGVELMLLSMSNLPQQVALGSFTAHEPPQSPSSQEIS